MIYSVRHVTKFRYTPAVRESVMEVRMQPRSDEGQRCLSFSLDVEIEGRLPWRAKPAGGATTD